MVYFQENHWYPGFNKAVKRKVFQLLLKQEATLLLCLECISLFDAIIFVNLDL